MRAKARVARRPATNSGQRRPTAKPVSVAPLGTAKPIEMKPARPPKEEAAADIRRMKRPTGLRRPVSTAADRKRVVEGKGVSGRVDLGGRRSFTKKSHLEPNPHDSYQHNYSQCRIPLN